MFGRMLPMVLRTAAAINAVVPRQWGGGKAEQYE
jgi:hypothetical protein